MSRRSGFTLVELLVVVAILSLLLSILAPSLRRAKSLTRRVVCSSNLHQSVQAMISYSAHNTGRLPRTLAHPGYGGYYWDRDFGQQFVDGYLGGQYDVLYCGELLASLPHTMGTYAYLDQAVHAKWWWITRSDMILQQGYSFRNIMYESMTNAGMPQSVYVRRNTESPSKALIADFAVFDFQGGGWSWTTAHWDDGHSQCIGGNVALLSGSVLWRTLNENQDKSEMKPQYVLAGRWQYWW